MKLLQLLENTSPQFPTTKREVENILKRRRFQNYTINDDLTVDVDGDVNLVKKNLHFLPVKFGKVSGNFYCHDNLLNSLVGSPREVGGNFFCSNNSMLSLKGAPREVGGDFSCSFNHFATLEGAPREVGGDFYCQGNSLLISLKGSPREVGGSFLCKNTGLKSLDGIGNVQGQIICDLS